MATFVRVVETGSFSAAARALRLSPSAVSKLVTRLETRMGVRLFARSTRKLAPTPEGEIYHRSCVAILSQVDQAELAVAACATPHGRVRVNASVPVGARLIVPIVPAFLARFPHAQVDITLTDTVVDLLSERADVAVRAGPLPDSAFAARKLLESPRVVVASPAYLKHHGVPATPNDLVRHNCLNFNFRRAEEGWPFRIGTATRRMWVQGTASAGDGETLRSLTLAGVGLARLAEFHIASDIDSGRLVPVLEDFNPGDCEPVHALFLAGASMPSRVRAFVDFLVESVVQQNASEKVLS